MKAQILKIAGVKSEKEFYKKYPTEEAFFKAHPEAAMMQKPTRQFGGHFIQEKQNELMGMAKQYGPMLMQLAPMLLEEGGEETELADMQKMRMRHQNAQQAVNAADILVNAFMSDGGSPSAGIPNVGMPPVGYGTPQYTTPIAPSVADTSYEDMLLNMLRERQSVSKPVRTPSYYERPGLDPGFFDPQKSKGVKNSNSLRTGKYRFADYNLSREEALQQMSYPGYKKGGSTYSGGLWYQNGGHVVDSEHHYADLIKENPIKGFFIDGIAKVWQGAEDALTGAGKAIGKGVAQFAPANNQMSAEDRERIFNDFRPVEYPGVMNTGVKYIQHVTGWGDKKPPMRDWEGDYDIGEEAWRRALDLDTKGKYIQQSKYRPSTATDPNAQYYRVSRDVIDPQKFIDYVKSGEFDKRKQRTKNGKNEYVQISSMSPFLRENFMPEEDFKQIDPLQRFQIYRGYDEKKKMPYVSYADTYDFDFAPANKMIKPYDFYDRFYYYPDKKKKGGSTYSGGVWFQNGGAPILGANLWQPQLANADITKQATQDLNQTNAAQSKLAQTAGMFTGILNQNQNNSGLNSPFTVGANTTLGTIPQAKPQMPMTTPAAQTPNPQMPGSTLFNPRAFGSGINQFTQPAALNLSTTGKNPYLNEALKGKEYNPNATSVAGADVSGMFAKNVAAGNEKQQGFDFNSKLNAVQKKLAEGMAGDPTIGAIGDIIEGINKKKDYNAALDKQRRNYSTDYAYNTSYSTAANKGQYDMYGTMMPNQIGGNLSFNGMNQKYNMVKNMFELGGAYETSATSWVPQEIGKPMDEPFFVAPGSDARPAVYNPGPAAPAPAVASANIGDLPLDADAMLATIGLQESSSKKGQTALGLRTKLVGPDGRRGSASGTYQITESTLKGIYDKHFNGQYGNYTQFKSAFNSNPDVEYSAAKALMNDHIKQYGIYALGAWYQPSFAARAAKGDMSVMGTIPAPEFGNKVTFGDYFNKSITNYRKALGLPSGEIATKKGVNISQLQPNLMSFAQTMSSNFPGIKISSGNDSTKHMKGSRHYENKAIDIGANSSDPKAYAQLKKFLSANPGLKKQYGIEDIIDEGDHLHVELFRDGGEYNLTEAQIMQIKAMGGDVEFL